jgi:hypothetical protein
MKQIVESFYNWYSNQVRNPKYRWLIVLGTIAYLFRLALDYRKSRRSEQVQESEDLVTVGSTPVETVVESK